MKGIRKPAQLFDCTRHFRTIPLFKFSCDHINLFVRYVLYCYLFSKAIDIRYADDENLISSVKNENFLFECKIHYFRYKNLFVFNASNEYSWELVTCVISLSNVLIRRSRIFFLKEITIIKIRRRNYYYWLIGLEISSIIMKI